MNDHQAICKIGSLLLHSATMSHATIFSYGKGVNALGIVRSLGRSGIPVRVVCLGGGDNLAVRSRYCSSAVFVDESRLENWRDSAQDSEGKWHGPSVVYFDNDRMLAQWAEGKIQLGEEDVSTSPKDEVRRLLDKRIQLESAGLAGFGVPQSWFPQTFEDIAKIKPIAASRLIAKGRFSGRSERSPFKVLLAENGEKLVDLLKRYSVSPDELMIQDFVEGCDANLWVGMCYFGHSEKIRKIVSGQKIIQSGSGGGGVMALGATRRNPAFEQLCHNLKQHLGYSGLLGVEAKYCPSEDRFYFIEVSMRPERFNGLAACSGVNLNLLAYRDLTNEKDLSGIEKEPRQVAWIDSNGCLGTLRKRRDWRIASRLLANLHRIRGSAILSWDDPGVIFPKRGMRG